MSALARSLAKALDLTDHELDDFLATLRNRGGAIAGSFPLLHACKPCLADWHPETRKEIRLLIWIAKQFDLALPRLALESIGNTLQLAAFQGDTMDIDLFRPWQTLWTPQQYWLRGWTRLPNEDRTGAYLLIPKVVDVQRWVKNGQELNMISIQCSMQEFLESFDLSFCQVTYDGTLEPCPTRMRGTANIAKYAGILKRIEARIQDWREYELLGYTLPGLSDYQFVDLAHKLANTMQERMEKYERRRFTIENRGELLELIQRARGVS